MPGCATPIAYWLSASWSPMTASPYVRSPNRVHIMWNRGGTGAGQYHCTSTSTRYSCLDPYQNLANLIQSLTLNTDVPFNSRFDVKQTVVHRFRFDVGSDGGREEREQHFLFPLMDLSSSRFIFTVVILIKDCRAESRFP